MAILSNGWFVGLGTSLIAGILISLVSYLFISKRKRREYIQNVSMANREIIYAIRPGIAEGNVPTLDVLEALAAATARSYGLRRNELFSTKEVGEELIKEVMDSSFLSSTQKAQYCAQLAPLQNVRSQGNDKSTDALRDRRGDRQRKESLFTSALLGIVSTLLALIYSFSQFSNSVSKFLGSPMMVRLGDIFGYTAAIALALSILQRLLKDVFKRNEKLMWKTPDRDTYKELLQKQLEETKVNNKSQ